MKFTLTGFLLNHASAIFWAAIHQKFFGVPKRASNAREALIRPLVGSAIVTAGAYVTDYYLVPKRLTPGFEKRLSNTALAAIYGALAVGLAAGNFIATRKS